MVDIRKSDEILVSQKALDATRSELKTEMTEIRIEMRAGFERSDSKMNILESKADALESKIDVLESKMDRLDSKIDTGDASLRTEIASVNTNLRQEIASVNENLKKEIASVKSELKTDIELLRCELKADIAEVKSDVQKVLVAVHRVTALVEEQNSRNRYVLDGYQSLHDRQDRVESRVDELETTIQRITKDV